MNKTTTEVETMEDASFVSSDFGDIQKEITEFVRELRERENWSQTLLAEKLGMTQNGYAKFERQETKDISLSRLLQISKVFKVDVTDMLGNKKDKGALCVIRGNSNSNNHNHFYAGGADEAMGHEIEKLKLELDYQKKLYEQQLKQTELLEKLVSSLEQ